jgi:hypothetical protein
MPNIRIDTGRATLAALLFAASMTATGALAQTATDSAPGKPLQLVQNIKPASKAVATKSTKTAAKAASKTKATRHRTFAQRKRAPAPAQIAQGPADARSTAPALPFAGAAAVAALSLLPAETMPSELVVGGQTVQFGSPEKLNEIDLAAKDDIASAGAANPQPGNDVAEAAAKSDLANAPPQSLANTAAPSEIGSTAWLLQVLAALGGAVAAGSAAWLLIGSAPQRMYG